MPLKNDREYRSFAFELRKKDEDDQSSFLVEGYASTFEEYTLGETEDAVYNERIAKDAFDDADQTDVVFLLDHTGRVYARTKNGTVKLSVDDHGLFTQTDLSKTTTSREVFEDIEAGNYQQMSFAFTVDDDDIEETGKTEDGRPIYTRVIKRMKKLYDISAVAFPANPTTDIGVATRAAFDGAIEKLKAERLIEEQRRQAVARAEALVKIKLLEVIES